MSFKSLTGIAAGLLMTLVSMIGAAPADAQMKIAVIEVQRIITDSQTGKAVLGELEKYSKQQQDLLTQKRDTIEQLRTRISEGQLSLAEDKLEELQKELESKTIELRRSADDAQREVSRRQEEAFKQIEKKVMPILQKMGEEGGYTMIFRKFESGLVYATEEIDITSAVISRLDSGAAGS